MMKKYLEVGQIVGTHGVRGEVRVQPWCDEPAFMLQFKRLYYDAQGQKAVDVKGARVHGNLALLLLDGTDTLEEAAALRNRVLFMRREDAPLPTGQYYIADLEGCEVFDADNGEKCYGTLCEVSKTGANDVWHIKAQNGREYLIPAIPDVVVETDVEANKVVIRPLKGIFDDED